MEALNNLSEAAKIALEKAFTASSDLEDTALVRLHPPGSGFRDRSTQEAFERWLQPSEDELVGYSIKAMFINAGMCIKGKLVTKVFDAGINRIRIMFDDGSQHKFEYDERVRVTES